MIVSLPPLDETIPQEERLRIIDEAIEKQQRAIDELHIPLLALKTRRNASIPISSLPPEILCRIFSFAQVPELDKMGREIASLEWINLTYVCHHWRSVAVNAPSLWIDPPIGNVEWVAEMLRRSKESSLVIKIDGGRTLGMELALGDIHRIKELSIRHIGSDTWNILGKMLPVSAPRLERFCLVGQHIGMRMRYGAVNYPLFPLSISKHILRETAPLRQLELEHCTFNWISHSHLLSSLTHLKLHRLSQDSAVTEKQFTDALKSMPDLEVLDLHNAFPVVQAEQFCTMYEEVHFHRLQKLCIHDSATTAVKVFFCSVTFPPTTMVKVVCPKSDSSDDDNDAPADFLEIISGLIQSYSKPHPKAAFQSLILQKTGLGNRDVGVRMQLFTEALGDFDMISHVEATPRMDLVLHCATHSEDIKQLLSDICDSGMLDDIKHVCLPEKVPNLRSETIANTLGRLPWIHSVVAARSGTRRFFNALCSRVSVAGTSGSTENSELALPFPRLSSIALYYAYFVEPQLVDLREHPSAVSTNGIRSILMHRCDFGVPIDNLFIHDCSGFSLRDMELLREIVVNVNGDLDAYSSGDESEEDEQVEY